MWELFIFFPNIMEEENVCSVEAKCRGGVSRLCLVYEEAATQSMPPRSALHAAYMTHVLSVAMSSENLKTLRQLE